MVRIAAFTLLTILVTMSSPSTQQLRSFVSGNALHDHCQDAVRRMICAGYMTAIADLLSATPDEEFFGRLVCLPNGVTNGQLREVGSRYLANNPATRHAAAAELVVAAFAEAWPCR